MPMTCTNWYRFHRSYCLPPHHGGRRVHASGKNPGGVVGNEPPFPKMRTGQWCTNGRPLFYEKLPAVWGFFPCHSKTGNSRSGPRVKGGFAAYLPPTEGGGFGPAGTITGGGLTGNLPAHPATAALFRPPLSASDAYEPGKRSYCPRTQTL